LSSPSEAKTRKGLIDPALKQAGWDINNPDQVGIEIPVDEFDPQAWRALEARLRRLRETGAVYEVELPKGVSDYVLYRPDGDIIAVVEAKRASTAPLLAQAQTEFYVQEIAKGQDFAPFAFMTNGYRTEFWDVGHANPPPGGRLFLPRRPGQSLLHSPEPNASHWRTHQPQDHRPTLPTGGHATPL